MIYVRFFSNRLLLLNQFHDVLPGSCIEMAVDDALGYYDGSLRLWSYQSQNVSVVIQMLKTSYCVVEIRTDGAALLHDACGAMVSKGTSDGVFNSLPWERIEVIQTQDGAGQPRLGMLNVTSRFAN